MASVGIDIVEIDRIKLETEFLKKFLHSEEIKLLESFDSDKRKLEFAAGRWAAKEALFKCVDAKFLFKDINVTYKNSKPVFENSDFQNLSLSISHEKNYAVAIVIEFLIN